MLAIECARSLAKHHSNSDCYNLQLMSFRKLLGSQKSQKQPKQPQEDNGKLHIDFWSTVRQLVVVQSCLNEDGEASIELPPESPASDGEGEEGGEHESEALNATAVLLVQDYEIVSVALDVSTTFKSISITIYCVSRAGEVR